MNDNIDGLRFYVCTCGYSYLVICHPISSKFKFDSKFYHRHTELIVQYNICLKTILQQCILETVFSVSS